LIPFNPETLASLADYLRIENFNAVAVGFNVHDVCFYIQPKFLWMKKIELKFKIETALVV